MKFKSFTMSLITGSVVAGLAFTPLPAHAWNLICGVSINLREASSERKWDADAYSIKGMGMYYLAVSDLQRLQLNEDGSVVNPEVLEGGEKSSERAIRYLGESVAAYESALSIAEEVGLGDEKGLGMLRSLVEQTRGINSQLQEGLLPELGQFHATTQLVMEYTQYGVELSNKHLAEGLGGHGEGGARFRLE